MDETSGSSLSDIDLIGEDVSLSIETCSIHPENYENRLSLSTSFAFGLVNLAEARVQAPDDPYRLAKCQLMLARGSVNERYADVGCRVPHLASQSLVARKLGLRMRSSRIWIDEYPMDQPPLSLERCAEQLWFGRADCGVASDLCSFILDECPELPGFTRQRVVQKIRRLNLM